MMLELIVIFEQHEENYIFEISYTFAISVTIYCVEIQAHRISAL